MNRIKRKNKINDEEIIAVVFIGIIFSSLFFTIFTNYKLIKDEIKKFGTKKKLIIMKKYHKLQIKAKVF